MSSEKKHPLTDDEKFDGEHASKRLKPDSNRTVTDPITNNVAGLHILAQQYREENNHKKTIEICSKIIEIEPRNRDAYKLRSHSYAAQKIYALAIADLRHASELSSYTEYKRDLSTYYTSYCHQLLKKRDLPEAIKACNNRILVEKDRYDEIDTHHDLLDFSMDLTRASHNTSYAQMCREIKNLRISIDIEQLHQQAEAHYFDENYEATIDIYDTIINKDKAVRLIDGCFNIPQNHRGKALTFCMRGDCHIALGEHDKAAADYEAAISDDEFEARGSENLKKLNPVYHHKLGIAYAAKKDFANAIACGKKALEIADAARTHRDYVQKFETTLRNHYKKQIRQLSDECIDQTGRRPGVRTTSIQNHEPAETTVISTVEPETVRRTSHRLLGRTEAQQRIINLYFPPGHAAVQR